MLPERGGGSYTTNVDGDDGQQVAGEAQPDNAPGGSIAVYFSEDIAKEIAEGENDNTGWD